MVESNRFHLKPSEKKRKEPATVLTNLSLIGTGYRSDCCYGWTSKNETGSGIEFPPLYCIYCTDTGFCSLSLWDSSILIKSEFQRNHLYFLQDYYQIDQEASWHLGDHSRVGLFLVSLIPSCLLNQNVRAEKLC